MGYHWVRISPWFSCIYTKDFHISSSLPTFKIILINSFALLLSLSILGWRLVGLSGIHPSLEISPAEQGLCCWGLRGEWRCSTFWIWMWDLVYKFCFGFGFWIWQPLILTFALTIKQAATQEELSTHQWHQAIGTLWQCNLALPDRSCT